MLSPQRNVILGYPYSGAFYWLAEKEYQYFNRGMKEAYTGSHPYYIRLYGDHSQSTINNCISLSLIFDNIYVLGADAMLPGINPAQDTEILNNKDLNLNVYWDWSTMHTFKLNEHEVKLHLKDPVIFKILSAYSKEDVAAILQNILIQNYVAERYDCAIIGNANHIALTKQLFELHPELFSRKDIPVSELQPFLVGLNHLFNIQSIGFKVDSFTEFSTLRQNKALNKYAKSFSNYLSGNVIEDSVNEAMLLKDMMNVLETDSVKDNIIGGLSINATVAGIMSLAGNIPLLGGHINTATSLTAGAAGFLGVTLDIASRITDGLKNNWIHLVPEINDSLTRAKIESRIKALSS